MLFLNTRKTSSQHSCFRLRWFHGGHPLFYALADQFEINRERRRGSNTKLEHKVQGLFTAAVPRQILRRKWKSTVSWSTVGWWHIQCDSFELGADPYSMQNSLRSWSMPTSPVPCLSVPIPAPPPLWLQPELNKLLLCPIPFDNNHILLKTSYISLVTT